MSENAVIQKKDDFIMLPTSDFCFKELMQNSKVRKGIISALLGISPEEIAGTKLLPTSTTEEYPDGKLGILDVLIKLENGTQVGWKCRWRNMTTGLIGFYFICVECLPVRSRKEILTIN